MRSSQFVCVTGLIFALAAAPAMAQTGAGSIQDTVKDASGALVPKAGVKIGHLATSVALETMTNGAGFYAFSQTPIERYRIFAQAPGMSPWEADVEASTGQTALVEAALKVGTSVSGLSQPGSNGILSLQNSANSARTMQLSIRLTW